MQQHRRLEVALVAWLASQRAQHADRRLLRDAVAKVAAAAPAREPWAARRARRSAAPPDVAHDDAALALWRWPIAVGGPGLFLRLERHVADADLCGGGARPDASARGLCGRLVDHSPCWQGRLPTKAPLVPAPPAPVAVRAGLCGQCTRTVMASRRFAGMTTPECRCGEKCQPAQQTKRVGHGRHTRAARAPLTQLSQLLASGKRQRDEPHHVEAGPARGSAQQWHGGVRTASHPRIVSVGQRKACARAPLRQPPSAPFEGASRTPGWK